MTRELDFYCFFQHTNLVIQISFSTHLGLSSHPFCHSDTLSTHCSLSSDPLRYSDTILNHFWAFTTPIWSLRYHFRPILGFHHLEGDPKLIERGGLRFDGGVFQLAEGIFYLFGGGFHLEGGVFRLNKGGFTRRKEFFT